MNKIIKKIIQFIIGKPLKQIYLYYLKTNNWIPSFLRTPWILNNFGQLMFTYELNPNYYTALEMLNIMIGDCKSYSKFYKDLLNPKLNPYLLLITVVNPNDSKDLKAHMTCIFSYDNITLHYIDNNGSVEFNFYKDDNIGKDICKKIYSGYQLLKTEKAL